MAGGGFVALALKPEALADDCERAALVVTARPAPASCSPAVMSGDRLRGQGATALWRKRDGFAVDAVRPRGIDRPWSPAVAGTAETEATLSPHPNAAHPNAAHPNAARPVDATPAEADQQGED
jgi:competence protein ComEC